MKKTFLLILAFCSLFMLTRAQSLMTVREIYDYGIGDVFQRQNYYSGLPPTIMTTTITGKSYSAMLDTLYYTYDETAYTPPACQSCTAIYDTTQGGQWAYTHLDDTVGAHLGVRPHYWYIDCIDTAGYTGIWLDTLYFDTTFCNRQITKINEMNNGGVVDSCYYYFEPEFGEYQYGNGIGLKHYRYNSCGQGGTQGCLQQNSLIFYIKGNDSCGLRFAVPLPLATDEPRAAATFKMVPNPAHAQSQLIFTRQQQQTHVTVTNLMGTIVQTITFSGNELTLDVTELAAGTYFVQVNDGLQTYSTKLMIQ